MEQPVGCQATNTSSHTYAEKHGDLLGNVYSRAPVTEQRRQFGALDTGTLK